MIKHLRVIQLISLLTSVSDLICKVVDLECMNMHLRCVNSRSYRFFPLDRSTQPLCWVSFAHNLCKSPEVIRRASGSEPAYMFLNATPLHFLHISLFPGFFDSGIQPHTLASLFIF